MAEEEIFDENEKKRQEQKQKMLEDKKIQLSEIERRRNEKRQKQKRNKIMLITLVCALAVAAAGIGVYYVAQNLTETTEIEATPMPTVSATATVMPSESPSASPMPTADTTAAPYTETNGTNTAASSENSNTQSWKSTGNTGSSTSSSSSSNNTSSSGSSSASVSNGNSSSASASSTASAASSTSNATLVANAVNSGISQDKISAQLAVGGEVIHNTGTGKYLMTFVTGGKKYYAHVSEGSTTEQINNKTYTVTAEPTDETYNGNTVYEITVLTNYEGDYILPASGTKLLTNDNIKGMSKYDIALARNEIYARHGRKFQTAEYSKYFNGKSWYKLNPNYNYSDDNANLNDIETQNVNFLLKAERN